MAGEREAHHHDRLVQQGLRSQAGCLAESREKRVDPLRARPAEVGQIALIECPVGFQHDAAAPETLERRVQLACRVGAATEDPIIESGPRQRLHLLVNERVGVESETSSTKPRRARGRAETNPAPRPGRARVPAVTADVLFKGTVGGTLAPGATGYADLKASVERLLALPPETVIHPGHTLPTTVAEERESNPFFRVWTGRDPEGDEECTVRGDPATLVLWAPDYDGTNKAWVRFPNGEDAIVGGSQVAR